MDYPSQRAFMGVLYDTGGDYAQGGLCTGVLFMAGEKRGGGKKTASTNSFLIAAINILH